MRSIFIILIGLFIGGLYPVKAQDVNETLTEIEINIDSLIQDSLRKAFILNHKPLTQAEKSILVVQKTPSPYGSYVTYYLSNTGWYSLSIPRGALYSPKRVRPNLEWIFYSFLFLFLLAALLAKYSNGLLRKLWKIYVNDGFIYRQSKDQMAQQPIVTISLNFLFILSSGLFVFFGMGWNFEFKGDVRWMILIASFLIIGFVYLFKHIFFKILGWAFGQEEAFDDYLFVVFLNNKLAGLIFLFSSFIMAFSDQGSSSLIFKLTLFLIGLMLMYRFLRGYQVFSRQSRIGFFTLLLAFLSLELIPSAVIIKFIAKSFNLFITGMI